MAHMRLFRVTRYSPGVDEEGPSARGTGGDEILRALAAWVRILEISSAGDALSEVDLASRSTLLEFRGDKGISSCTRVGVAAGRGGRTKDVVLIGGGPDRSVHPSDMGRSHGRRKLDLAGKPDPAVATELPPSEPRC